MTARICVFTEPHRGADYDDQLRFAQHVEACGFEGFFRADHYQAMGSHPGLPGPTDAWLTLGALARETSRIRLGTLVTSATFRLPGPLAVTVAQVDRMSGGGSSWASAPVGTNASTPRTASRSRPPRSVSIGWRSSWP